jgi:hypothetical protein
MLNGSVQANDQNAVSPSVAGTLGGAKLTIQVGFNAALFHGVASDWQ